MSPSKLHAVRVAPCRKHAGSENFYAGGGSGVVWRWVKGVRRQVGAAAGLVGAAARDWRLRCLGLVLAVRRELGLNAAVSALIAAGSRLVAAGHGAGRYGFSGLVGAQFRFLAGARRPGRRAAASRTFATSRRHAGGMEMTSPTVRSLLLVPSTVTDAAVEDGVGFEPTIVEVVAGPHTDPDGSPRSGC